jgi:predicted phage terminase large subunit-like protein
VKAESDLERAKTVLQFREGITDRLNNMDEDSIIVMMQRLHANDVSGVIEEMGLDYERVVIPMEYEPKRARMTSIGWKDPRKNDGELMCPERWSKPNVEKLKRAKGSYAWAGQYQQRPTPREGGLFKRDWFKGRMLKAAPAFIHEVRHWDLADTDLKATDTTGARSAGVRMGITADGRFVVTDCLAVGRENVAPLIKSTAVGDGKRIEVSLPKDPGQAGKVQGRSHVKLLAGWNVHVERETGDKLSRAVPLATQAEAGNLWYVEGPWNEEYIDEMCNFPGGARKDIADASSGAFGRLVPYMPDDTAGDGMAGAEAIEHGVDPDSRPWGSRGDSDPDADVWS